MRILSFVVVLLLLPVTTYAQKNVPDFDSMSASELDRWAQTEMNCHKLEALLREHEPHGRKELGGIPDRMLKHLEDCHKVNHSYSSFILGKTRMSGLPINYIDYSEAADFFEHAARYGNKEAAHFALALRLEHEEAFDYDKIVANTYVLEGLDGKDYSYVRTNAEELRDKREARNAAKEDLDRINAQICSKARALLGLGQKRNDPGLIAEARATMRESC